MALGTRLAVASALESQREAVITGFRNHFTTSGSRWVKDDTWAEEAVAQAGYVFSDVVDSVRSGDIQVNDAAIALAWQVGADHVEARMHPAESTRCATILFEVVLGTLMELVAHQPQAAPIIQTAIQALNRSIMARFRWSAEAYVSFLLKRVHQQQLSEQRHFLRELHDRAGGSTSVVIRNLELAQIYTETNPCRVQEKILVAYQASMQTLNTIRNLAAKLRPRSKVNGLENALREFLETMDEGRVKVDLTVSGSEAWAPPHTLDEVFLVVREALRNAFSHANASTVLSHINIAPHEIRVCVSDNGVGFQPIETMPTAIGSGLASMQERIEMLGGKLILTSFPGQGTQVEALVPLSSVTK